MRVLNHLELAGAMERSGIGTAVRQQRNALARTDVEVVTTIRDHIRGHTAGRRNPTAVLEAIGADGLDLVHCNVIGPGTLGIVSWLSATGTPLVLHAHVTSEDFAGSFRGSTILSGPLRRYLRWLYSQADVVACPSEYTKSILSAYPVDAPIRVISNGVDVDRLNGFEDLREQYRDRYRLSGTVVFSVGNVFERKGLTTFCRLAQETHYEFVWFGPYERGLLASPAVRQWTRNPPTPSRSQAGSRISGAHTLPATSSVFRRPSRIRESPCSKRWPVASLSYSADCRFSRNCTPTAKTV